MNFGAGDDASKRAAARWWWAIIPIVALGVMPPELVAGVSHTDSVRYNLVWPAQFGELFRAGHFYPRWLPHSWDGLGSPTFYFYPPLFFWVAASIGAAAPLEASVSLASAAILAASGFAMRAWLIEQTAHKAALLGGLAYMLAPYHLYDIYGRGALAEACAYVALPIIMLAIRRVGEGRAIAIALLAIGYCLLLLSHLPVALLASVTAIPAFACYMAFTRGGRAWVKLGWCLFGGLLGIGLAAIYVLPAMTLLPHVSAGALGGTFYSPQSWFFLRPDSWTSPSRMLLIIPLSLATLLLTLGAARAGRRQDVTFWAALMIGLFVLIAGLVPAIWRIPLLSQVQFPWRLLVVAEFVAITALSLGRPHWRGGLTLAGCVMAALGAILVLGVANVHIRERLAEGEGPARSIVEEMREAPEYLPPGIDLALDDRQRSVPSEILLPAVQEARAEAQGVSVRTNGLPNGGMDVTVFSPVATVIIARRFVFPHWTLTRNGERRPVEARDALVAWRAPPGRSVYRLEPGRVPIERLAAAISLGSLLILAVTALRWRRYKLVGGDR
jgi:hypothetical protein